MGKTYDSNGPQLSAQAVEAGCAVTASGPIPEDAEQLRGAIEAAQESSDILIRSG
jgi:molybdopterin biosynthesis enzyme